MAASGVIEDLTEEEKYLWAIFSDESGLDLAEFCWVDEIREHDLPNDDGEINTATSPSSFCWRAWPYQWAWFRCTDRQQIDQCIAEGTLILTERGQLPIEKVRIGDRVLTHKGRWQPVTYVWDQGEQPVVKVKGHGHPGLIVTDEHKFWIDRDWKVPQPGSPWVTPLLFPSATVPSIPERVYAPGRPSNIPNDVTDPGFLWLYGLFVAEGSCSSSFGKNGTVNRTTFSVHEDEVNEVERRLDKVGLRYNTQPVGTERCRNIVVNSRPLATWMSEHGGRGAHNKHLASWVFGLEFDQRMAVLDGMAYGDGYRRVSGRVEYTTTSKALACDAKLLASSLGYFVTMRRYEGRVNVIDGRTIAGGEGFVVGWCMNGRHNRVDSVVPAGTAHVYDIEVAEDHSFIAESIIVSNCARSVGKSLSIKLRGFAFPFVHPGQEMVITAPELNHLEPITDLIENQFYSSRLGRFMLQHGRSGVTHRPFKMNFKNGASIMGRIPQKDGKGVKGIHPLWLELDEAQDYPEPGWKELFETVKRGFFSQDPVWRAHGVTRGVRDKFHEYTTKGAAEGKWKVHRFTAMHRPIWSDEEREDKIALYHGREDPDYKRNVLGEHGDATSPIFVLHRLMACVDDDAESSYNTDEYTHFEITDSWLEQADTTIEQELDLPAYHTDRYKTFWAGMDVGWTNHPSEILVFAEEVMAPDEYKHYKSTTELGRRKAVPPLPTIPRLKLVCRISMSRIGSPDQKTAILKVIEHYKPKAFSFDATGAGLPMFQDIQADLESPEWVNVKTVVKGYNFSGNILVDFDQTIDVDDWATKEDIIKETGIKRNTVEYSTDKLRFLIDNGRFWLPWDKDLLAEFEGQTYKVTKTALNAYGKREYSLGKFHALDAARMMALGWAQFAIEEFVKKDTQVPVLDLFIGA